MANKGYELATDLEVLKQRLKEHQIPPIINGNCKVNPFVNTRLNDVLLQVAKMYGVRRILIRRTNHVIKKGVAVGGFYENKKIFIDVDKYGLPYLSKIIHTFCHELAHHIQDTILEEHYEYLNNYLPKIIVYEAVAERLAYHIYKKHFEHWQVLSRPNFSTYNNQKDLMWLIQYHNYEISEDDDVFSNKKRQRSRNRDSKKTTKGR